MTLKTDTLIIGATFFGLGAAIASPEKTIVVESSSLLCKEFAASFCQKEPRVINTVTAVGTAFKTDLSSRGLLTESGEMYIQPCVFVLSDRIRKEKVKLMLSTHVLSVEKSEKGYLVRLCNQSGEFYIEANKILDTTSTGVFGRYARKKTLFCIVEKDGDIKNEITGLSYLKVPLEDEDSWETARIKLLNKLQERNLKVMMYANAFCYLDSPVQNIKTADDSIYMPSDGFYNPLAAFEGGVLCGTEKL